MTKSEFVAKAQKLAVKHNKLMRMANDDMTSVDEAIDYRMRAQVIRQQIERMAEYIDRRDDAELNSRINKLRKTVALEKAARDRRSLRHRARSFIGNLALLFVGVKWLDSLKH